MDTTTMIGAAALGALMVMGCTTVTTTRGPDGETAYILRCRTSEACYEQASETCPEGYVLRSTTIASVETGGTELLVSCKRDLPSAR